VCLCNALYCSDFFLCIDSVLELDCAFDLINYSA
jgi:hypothetical protein